MAESPPNASERIGLIGIGLLGWALAERLIAVGFQVSGYDRDPQARAALDSLGGTAADRPSQVATAARRIVLCLPDRDIVRAVLTTIDPALTAGHVLIDTTTGDSRTAVELTESLAPRGVAYIEATISGSSDHVRHRDVLVMTGGDPTVCADCRGLFDAFARAVLHAGPAGSAAKLKLATNLVLGLNRAALAEGLAFARAIGLDLGVTLEALREGLAYSRIMDSKGPKLLAGDFTPQAKLSQHLKDVRLMLAAAEEAGLPLPLSEAHRRLLDAAVAAGWGELDNSAIFRVYEATTEHTKTHERKTEQDRNIDDRKSC
jgi:3-hydroxyisobutyrate dehydrogenase-like beta-hydroxyacid dehydrogenase